MANMDEIITNGEICTTGAVDGVLITNESIIEREPLPLPVRRVVNSMSAGFRVGWLDGETTDPDDPVDSFTLTAGAGVGSPWMVLTIRLRDGETISEIVDMRDTVAAWIRAALAAGV